VLQEVLRQLVLDDLGHGWDGQGERPKPYANGDPPVALSNLSSSFYI